ncbi:MAG: peptidoglycan D,D-transpeptidase FtsI family protein [Deltaproteobacteria bacterium]
MTFFFLRLLGIQFLRADFLSRLAARQHTYYMELEPKRGGIYDRNMRPLAVNVATYSLYAVPPDVEDKAGTADRLAQLLGMDAGEIRGRLSRPKQFVWIARKLDWEKMKEISDLKIAGLAFLKESRRSYPNASLASQLLGFAGLDNIGLEGLEKTYDAYLRGTPGWTYLLRDARQRPLAVTDIVQPPVDGYSLVLTIDEVIQFIAERELDQAFAKYKAKGALCVVMDVATGAILACVSRPAYDLNAPGTFPMEARRNRVVTDFFEPGSVFKIVTASAALNEKAFGLGDKIFCENGTYRVANHTLHDVHEYGWLPFLEVIGYSSNIGTTKIAQKLGEKPVHDYAAAFGFGAPTGSGISGEVGGILKPVSQWSKTSIGAVPIGQEVCVTGLQLAAAISAIANGGVLMKPYVVQAIVDKQGEVLHRFGPEGVRRVITEETAASMRQILAWVVENGTGRPARSKQAVFAGKTGTAQKVEPNGTYSHSKFMASFIGFAPAEAPRIAVVVVVDEPRPYYYGGVVAAPVFKAVAEDVLKYLEFSGNAAYASAP